MISIVLPFKNAQQYLAECIRSILDQSYSNWELVAVDDHSEDNSFDVLKKTAANDSRIHLIKNNGTGIIDALKTGHAVSKGHYITRMDADDIMPMEKLKILKLILDENGVGTIATGLVKYFSDHPISLGYQQYERWLNRLTTTAANFEEIYRECPIASPCWMAFQEDFKRCGGFNSEQYPEDYDLCFRFYQNGFKIGASTEILHLWREHQKRTSRNSLDYAIDKFVDMKLDYFLKLEVCPGDSIVLWSAGYKSKNIAKKLIDKKQSFKWVCTNKKKIGNSIYEVKIDDYRSLSIVKQPKVIVPVAIKKYQDMIAEFFSSIKCVKNKDYYFFS